MTRQCVSFDINIVCLIMSTEKPDRCKWIKFLEDFLSLFRRRNAGNSYVRTASAYSQAYLGDLKCGHEDAKFQENGNFHSFSSATSAINNCSSQRSDIENFIFQQIEGIIGNICLTHVFPSMQMYSYSAEVLNFFEPCELFPKEKKNLSSDAGSCSMSMWFLSSGLHKCWF